MKMICVPSQVIREGRDLNQQGQAARQEQASSNSPATFHGVPSGAWEATQKLARLPVNRAKAMDLEMIIRLISFLLFSMNKNLSPSSAEGSSVKLVSITVFALELL